MNSKVTVIPEAIPLSLLRASESSWPPSEWPHWHRYNGQTSNKYGSMDRVRIPPACLAALDYLAEVVAPHIGDSFIDYDLHAAGLHMMPPGGFLSGHYDAERHPIRPWKRTHSIVLSVNSEWNPEWGGEFELSGEIFPVQPGRVLIFETDNAWHRVHRVASASPQSRKTLALFAWKMDKTAEGTFSAKFCDNDQVKTQ